jgi:hypothetical protein
LLACKPAPVISALFVSDATLVTQVAQAIVPVEVIVPPVIGEVVAMLVTVPFPHAVSAALLNEHRNECAVESARI